MIPCRCQALNTLTGDAAEDYTRQHLDVLREDASGRAAVKCPVTEVEFVLEPAAGVYDGSGHRRLRRLN